MDKFYIQPSLLQKIQDEKPHPKTVPIFEFRFPRGLEVQKFRPSGHNRRAAVGEGEEKQTEEKVQSHFRRFRARKKGLLRRAR